MKGRTPFLVWLVVAGLALVAASVWEFQAEFESRPVTSNPGPSGTEGLAQLLRQSGFPVRIERSARYKARRGEVVVAIAPTYSNPMAEFFQAVEEGQGTNDPDPEPSRLLQTLARAANGGATVVYAEVPESLDDAYDSVSTANVESKFPQEREFKVSMSKDADDPDESWVANSQPYDWFNHDRVGWWVQVRIMGKGRAVIVADGLSATNRYLDASDNADYWVTMLATLGGRENGVLFVDALGGDESTPSLLASLGPWAVAAQWHALFVFVLGVWWLGQRFGSLLPSVVRDVTSRATTEALATVLAAGRQYGTAARIIANNRLIAIRRAQGLPPSTTPQHVLATAPTSVAEPLAQALALPDRAKAAAALSLVKQFDEAIVATNVLRFRQ